MKLYIVIIIGIIAIIVIALLYLKNLRKNKATQENQSISSVPEVSTKETQISKQPKQPEPPKPIVQFEELPFLYPEDNAALIEIKDKNLLSRIDSVIPGAFQIMTNTVTINAMGKLYEAIIPKGVALTHSKAMEGAVRGIFHGSNGKIAGQANLIPVDGRLVSINIAATLWTVASIVVGQHYMKNINVSLGKVNSNLVKISSFQNNEYRSKVMTLMAEVQTHAQFHLEIIENEELRKRELDHLKSLEHECAELLGQANLALKEFENFKELDYETYLTLTSEADIYYQYQQILLEIMLRIEELTYALNLGQVSKEYCNSMYLPFADQAKDALHSLENWHKFVTSELEINISMKNRRIQGVKGFFKSIVGDNYETLPDSLVTMLKRQHVGCPKALPDGPDLFKEDVHLIAKDGKLYYLPKSKLRNYDFRSSQLSLSSSTSSNEPLDKSWEDRLDEYMSQESIDGYSKALRLVDFHNPDNPQLVDVWRDALEAHPEFALELFDNVHNLLTDSITIWTQILAVHKKAFDTACNADLDELSAPLYETIGLLLCFKTMNIETRILGLKPGKAILKQFDYDIDSFNIAIAGDWNKLEKQVKQSINKQVRKKDDQLIERAHTLTDYAEAVGNSIYAIKIINRYIPLINNNISLKWRLAILNRNAHKWREYAHVLYQEILPNTETTIIKVDIYKELIRVYHDLLEDKNQVASMCNELLMVDPHNEEALHFASLYSYH